MENAFAKLDVKTYLENKRARTEEKEMLEGRRYVNERQEVIQRFVDKINRDREGTKYKPVTWPQINGQLRNTSVGNLKLFYKQCQQQKCFSSFFWWKLKQK